MKIDARLTHKKVRFDQDTDAHLVLTVTAPAVNTDKVRPKLALIMCIDTSGSMQGVKLDYAKQSVLKMIEHLKGDDVFGVVTFDSQVRIVADPKRIEGRKDEMRMTNFAGGMLKSIELLNDLDLGGDYIHRVVMFTDGQANCGPAKVPDEIIKLYKANAGHVTASAFGYGSGSDFSPDFLTEFAKEGKGNYAHIEDPDKALKAFGTELGGLVSTYATDLSIEIKPLNEHSIEKVISDVDADEENTGEVFIKVPDLLAEETRHIVVAVKLAKQKTHGPRAVNVFDLKLGYQTFDSLGKKETHTGEAKGRVQFVKEGDQDKKSDAALDDIVGLAQLVRAQLEAEEQAKKGNFAAAAAVMNDVSDSFTTRGNSRLAAASSNLGGRMASASLYAANNSYLRSFERGATRGMGVASYAAGADADLAELGVQLTNSAQTTTSAAFASDAIAQPVAPAASQAVVNPLGGLVDLSWTSGIQSQQIAGWTGSPNTPNGPGLSGSLLTSQSQVSLTQSQVSLTEPPVPVHETNKGDAKSSDKASK